MVLTARTAPVALCLQMAQQNRSPKKWWLQLFHVYPFGVAPGTWYWSIGPFSKLLGLSQRQATRRKKESRFQKQRISGGTDLNVVHVPDVPSQKITTKLGLPTHLKTWNLHQANRKRKWYSSKIWLQSRVLLSSIPGWFGISCARDRQSLERSRARKWQEH